MMSMFVIRIKFYPSAQKFVANYNFFRLFLGCKVSNETSNEKIICACNHLTSFGADFVVAPNPIDFAKLESKLAVSKQIRC